MGHATDLELKDLYDAALRFKDCGLWQDVDYTQFFILHDSETGIDGICHVLNLDSGGTALSLYLGEAGFDAFKYIFEDPQMSALDHVVLKGNLRRHCLTVSFSERNYIIQEDMENAMRAGYYFAEVKDQPVFNYSHPDHQSVPVAITDGWQCRFLTQALEQAIEVMGLSAKNAIKLPCLENNLYYLRFQENGVYNGIFVGANLYFQERDAVQPVAFSNDLLAYRVKKQVQLPVSLEAIQFYVPQPVVDLETDDSFYMLITALVDAEVGQIYFLDIQEQKSPDVQAILTALAKQLVELEMRPYYIVAEDQELMNLLSGFCEKTGIKLRKDRHVMKAHEFVEYILGEIAQNAGDREGGEIEELLNFVEEVTKLLKSQDELSHLTSCEQDNYQNIVQVFVCGMYTVKQQTPMEWDADAFREICETVVGEQFEGEVLSAVQGVMKHFVTIMGQEELIPNYRKILNVVDVFL
ncbi:MAG: hypothetical protein FWF59_08245 [Turicibacter sp.]|nr:hypothetical protein [Turicibacter sp.]